MQNTSICAGMKIEGIFWLSILKKNRRTSSRVIEVNNAKMANMLIEEVLVLDHTLHGCMKYNLTCRIKQCFNCYEYGHVSVYCQKSIKCGACSGLHKTLECPQDKAQKCPLCNGAHTSWEKQCEHRKKEYFRIEAAKQNTPYLHKVKSKTNPPIKENSRDMRLLPRLQQKFQSVNASL